MFQDYTINELVEETRKASEARHDLLVPSKGLRFFSARDENMNREYKLKLIGVGPEQNNYYSTTKHVESQLCAKLLIGSKYYSHMRDNLQQLLQQNVNVGLQARSDVYMLRTMNGQARALLSDRYDCLDNYDVMLNTFKTLQDLGMKQGVDFRIDSCSVYNHKLYIKILFPRVAGVVKQGDMIEAGILVTNCEIGTGKTKIEGFVNRLLCTNGMVNPLRTGLPDVKRHIGPKLEIGSFNNNTPYRTIFHNNESRLEVRVTLERMRDTIAYHADPANFEQLVRMATESTKDKISGDASAVVSKIGHLYTLTGGEQDIVLSRLLSHEAPAIGYNRWGLVNAITEASKQASNYQRATQLERRGGDLLAMPKSVWDKLSAATKVHEKEDVNRQLAY